MSRENLDALLEKCGRDLEVDLSLGDENDTLVQVDGKIDLYLAFDDKSEQLIISATCGNLPEEAEAKNRLLLEMLEANFRWTGTGGATLAVNSLDNTACFQFRESTERLDESRLQELLSKLVHIAEIWHARLQTGAWESVPAALAAGEEAPSADLAGSSDFIRI